MYVVKSSTVIVLPIRLNQLGAFVLIWSTVSALDGVEDASKFEQP